MSPRPDLLLPDGAVLLHIGPRKTGTTAIQDAFHHVRPQLAQHGVVYPGHSARPMAAGRALLGMAMPPGFPAPTIERWYGFVGEVVAARDERVCISDEDFASADVDQIGRIVEDLGGDRVHVVITGRRADRLIGSEWQERVKARLRQPYEEWVEAVLSDDVGTREATGFWEQHDLSNLVERWLSVLGQDRLTLIVLEGSPQGVIERTFERMLGLPSQTLDVAGLKANASLTLERAEILRALTATYQRNGWGGEVFRAFHREGVRQTFVSTHRLEGEHSIPPLPSDATKAIRAMSLDRIDTVRRSGIRVVGDLEALVPPEPGRTEVVNPQSELAISPDLVALALEAVIKSALRRERHSQRAREKELRKMRQQVERLRRRIDGHANDASVNQMRAHELIRIVAERGASRVRRMLRRKT